MYCNAHRNKNTYRPIHINNPSLVVIWNCMLIKLSLWIVSVSHPYLVRWPILASYYFFSGISNTLQKQGSSNIRNVF